MAEAQGQISPRVVPDSTAARPAMEHGLQLRDGTSIFYRHWVAPHPTTRWVLLLHRGHEHSGRYEELAQELRADGVHVFAYDARGHGRSSGERGWSPSFQDLVRDLDEVVHHVSREHALPVEDLAVLANSVGSVVAATWVHDHAPPIRALVLGTPALRVKLYVPFALFFLRLLVAVMPRAFVRSYVKARMLTHDDGQAADYQADPLIAGAIAVRVLVGMFDAARRITHDAAAIRVPVLMLSAGADWVVHLDPQRRLFDALGSATKRMQVYPGFFHDIFHERERHLPIREARSFLREAFASPRATHDGVAAHAHEAYARLRAPLPWHSPARAWFAAYRLFLSTVGRAGRGISIGFQHGFDSGPSLDHVYEDTPRGFTFVGRLVDAVYLAAPGWRGIRQRRIQLEQCIRTAVDQREHETGERVRILDVACGGGRYLLDVAARRNVEVLLRDGSDVCVEQARTAAMARGLQNVMVERADAFAPGSYPGAASVDIVVVSGLYELFTDDVVVERSLGAIRKSLKPGGVLIYTNQPWHPQQEMIARVLHNREAEPWVMRCRTQAEMDGLVRRAGLAKVHQETGEGGIFTVSMARAVAP